MSNKRVHRRVLSDEGCQPEKKSGDARVLPGESASREIVFPQRKAVPVLNFLFDRTHGTCAASSRRDFLKVGALGAGALALPELLRARAAAAATGTPIKDTSVVWLWLGGGPSHVETFDPKMTAPVEYRSVTGEIATTLPGVTLGGNFTELAKLTDQLAIVRTFAHTNTGHQGGTHFVMTGYDHTLADNGRPPIKPSIGSIVSRTLGSNHPTTGMPRYVRLNEIYGDGPSFLGAAAAPFDPNGEARKNMTLSISRDRFDQRRELLKALDRMNRDVDASGVMEGMSKFEEQAYQLVLGDATKAFDVGDEDPKVVERYGPGLGTQLLTARRLCEAGCGFVTIHYGGWDMHGGIKQGMQQLAPPLDRALAAFITDLRERSLQEKILLVVTGEFGRTPRINNGAGRDHWSSLTPLLLCGGGLKMGQVIGESARNVDVPKTQPYSPQDLMATIFHVLGLDPKLQYVNPSGRPVYMINDGKLIPELV